MAKLKFGDGLQMELAVPKTIEEVSEEVIVEHSDLFRDLRVSELDDKINDLKLEMISLSSELEHKIQKNRDSHGMLCSDVVRLEDDIKTLSRPIVKEIRLDKTNSDDLAALHRDMKSSIDSIHKVIKREVDAVESKMNKNMKILGIVNLIAIVILTVIK